jgi:hypothetical protein
MADSASSSSVFRYIRAFFAHIRRRLPVYFVLMVVIFGVLFVFRDDIYDTFIERHEEENTISFTAEGIPITDYGWKHGVYIGPVISPLHVGNWAQTYYNQSLYGNTTAAVYFNNTINWFLENRVAQEVNDGGGAVNVSHWLYEFAIYDMPAGWRSAMADAEILHSLALAYNETKSPVILQVCNEVLNGFEIPIEDGGNVLDLGDGGAWYPEVVVTDDLDPTYPDRRILNGFLFALEDLYGTYELLNETRILDIFNLGVQSALTHIGEYESPRNWTYYQLNPEKLAPVHYHRVHIRLTQSLYEITLNSTFAYYNSRWASWTEYPEDPFWVLTPRLMLEIQYGLLFMGLAGLAILGLDFLQMKVRASRQK